MNAVNAVNLSASDALVIRFDVDGDLLVRVDCMGNPMFVSRLSVQVDLDAPTPPYITANGYERRKNGTRAKNYREHYTTTLDDLPSPQREAIIEHVDDRLAAFGVARIAERIETR